MATDDRDELAEKFRKQREMDEASTQIADLLPKMWRGLYNGLLREGFTESQAMELLKVFISSKPE